MEHAPRRATERREHTGHEEGGMKAKYGKFLATLATSLVVMYFLAFQQIEQSGHFQWSLSVFYISLSMVSAMGMIMLVAMRKMLPDRRVNLVLFAMFAVILVGAFSAGRFEAGVGDDAFLRSMIPHHSRAILVCQEADLSDPEIIALCDQIIEAQRSEIEQMQRIMDERY